MAPAKKPTNGITVHPTMSTAVAAAQLQMVNALKDSKNPHFGSDYASLEVVRDIVIPAYAANGVAVVQEVIGAEGFAGLRTTLYWQGSADKPREEMPAGDILIPFGNPRNVPQSVGSMVTYTRRYQLAAAGGIAQADDDGNSNDRQQRPQNAPQRVPSGQSTQGRGQGPKSQPRHSGGVGRQNASRWAKSGCPKCGARVYDNRGDDSKTLFKCSAGKACKGARNGYAWAEFDDPEWDKKRQAELAGRMADSREADRALADGPGPGPGWPDGEGPPPYDDKDLPF